jgi:uncharacterized protein YdeI (YjbR/CyaY-like superfamily)
LDAPENSVHPFARTDGIGFLSHKKATGKSRISYNDSVEEALCFCWIDSKPNKLDEERSMLWFAPRKSNTGWSRLNKERVARVMAAGKIAPPGLRRTTSVLISEGSVKTPRRGVS